MEIVHERHERKFFGSTSLSAVELQSVVHATPDGNMVTYSVGLVDSLFGRASTTIISSYGHVTPDNKEQRLAAIDKDIVAAELLRSIISHGVKDLRRARDAVAAISATTELEKDTTE